MNKQEKEQYLRDYGTLKSQGKPFFPYAVTKDSVMAMVTMAVIVAMAIMFGAELGPKADPTSTTYTPRPEWYFFFLFELLKVIKAPALVPLATIGVPTICLILLFLLPFYDRGAERRLERRPIAMTAGVFVVLAIGYLTYLGAAAGPPTAIEIPIPANISSQGPEAVTNFKAGSAVVAQSGCAACHQFGENGNAGPGPALTKIGARMPSQAIQRTLINPSAPMPSFTALSKESPEQFAQMVGFLAALK